MSSSKPSKSHLIKSNRLCSPPEAGMGKLSSKPRTHFQAKMLGSFCLGTFLIGYSLNVFADAGPMPDPTMVDPNLTVSTLYSDLDGFDHPTSAADTIVDTKSLRNPIGMVFLPNKNPTVKYDMLVLEKNTGKVKRIKFDLNGTPMGDPVTVLDLAVNNFSERGLLSIALHPDFTNKGGKVYLFFTERLAVNNTPSGFSTLAGASTRVCLSAGPVTAGCPAGPTYPASVSRWIGPNAGDIAPLANDQLFTGTRITVPTSVFNGISNVTVPASSSNQVILPANIITADDNDDTSATVVTSPAGPPAFGADTIPASVDAPKTPLLGNRVAYFNFDPTASATLAGSGVVNTSGGALTYAGDIIRLRSFQNDRNTRNTSKISAGVDYCVSRAADGTCPPAVAFWTRNFNGNHNSGKIVFGHDKKLYIMLGDAGRRGMTQNIKKNLGILKDGQLMGKDDIFGGIAPDNAHMTGVVLRLNDNGTAPSDNPFYAKASKRVVETEAILGRSLNIASDNIHPSSEKVEVLNNFKKIYAYGLRNGFGLAIDPYSGNLWDAENSGKAFEEINLIKKAHNGGWIQVMGPIDRMDGPGGNSSSFFSQLGDFPSVTPDAGYPSSVTPPTGLLPSLMPTTWGDFKAIETLWGIGRSGGIGLSGAALTNTLTGPRGVQQPRFLAAPLPGFPNSDVIAASKAEALDAMYMPEGAHLRDPLYSTKHVVANGGLGFINGKALGKQNKGDLVFGSGVTRQQLETVTNTILTRPTGAPSTNGYEGTDYFYNWLLTSPLIPKPDGSLSTSNYGHLYKLHVKSHHRSKIGYSDPALFDGVADNRGIDDWVTEQSSVLFGLNFGTVTDVVTGPDGNLFVLSLNRLVCKGAVTSGCTGNAANDVSGTGRIYMISKVPGTPEGSDDDGDREDNDSNED
ncbi:MAG: PQQ-dependent sugar dehydrogenase [Gammaproteobacteria bacterium]|nr:PQQ-dependent sugar dehydrogenase [Gammaproteobacteria bacterium]